VEEYTQLCANIGKGKVEIRMSDDGVVHMRKFLSDALFAQVSHEGQARNSSVAKSPGF
jgi:hypothetical protein